MARKEKPKAKKAAAPANNAPAADAGAEKKKKPKKGKKPKGDTAENSAFDPKGKFSSPLLDLARRPDADADRCLEHAYGLLHFGAAGTYGEAWDADMDTVPVPSRGPKVDPDGGNELLETPLMVCAANGHVRLASTLLAFQADVARRDGEGRTPLHFAAGRAMLGVADLLIRSRAPLEQTDFLGRTPVLVAASAGSDCLGLLLRAKAHPGAESAAGFTALAYAAEAGRAEQVELLLRLKAEVEAQFGTTADTALHLAARRCHPETCKVLLRHGADPRTRNAQGQAALDACPVVGGDAVRATRNAIVAYGHAHGDDAAWARKSRMLEFAHTAADFTRFQLPETSRRRRVVEAALSRPESAASFGRLPRTVALRPATASGPGAGAVDSGRPLAEALAELPPALRKRREPVTRYAVSKPEDVAFQLMAGRPRRERPMTEFERADFAAATAPAPWRPGDAGRGSRLPPPPAQDIDL